MADLSEVLKEKEHMTTWKKVGTWDRKVIYIDTAPGTWWCLLGQMQWMMAGGYLSLWNIISFLTSQLDQLNVNICIFQTWALNWERLHPTSIWKTRSDFGIRLIPMACVGTVDRQLFICIYCIYIEWKKTYAAWWICLITIWQSQMFNHAQ